MRERELSEKKLNETYFTLCLFLFFAGIFVIGNYITMIIVQFLFIVVYMVLMRKGPSFSTLYRNHKIEGWLLLCWGISGCLSLYFSPYQEDLMIEAGHLLDNRPIRQFSIFMQILFAFYLYDFLKRANVSGKWFLLSSVFSVAFMALLLVILWNAREHPDPIPISYWMHDAPLGGSMRRAGWLITAAIAALLPFMFEIYKKRNLEWKIYLCLYVVLWAFLFWTGGRGALLSVLCTVAIYFAICLYYSFREKGYWLWVIGGAFAGLILSQFFVVTNYNNSWFIWWRMINYNDLDQYSAMRITLWAAVWDTIKEYPWLGVGIDGHRLMPNRENPMIHTHNVVLQFLLEWGVIGTTLLTGFMVKLLHNGFIKNCMNNKPDATAIASLLVIVSLTGHGMVDGIYFHPESIILIVVAFAVWLHRVEA